MALLPDSKKVDDMFSRFHRIPARERERERHGKTDERMDTQTSFDSMVRAICIASRGNNYTYSCDCPYYSRNLTDANKDIHNVPPGSIAAIVVSILLLLLLVIFVITVIVLCR